MLANDRWNSLSDFECPGMRKVRQAEFSFDEIDFTLSKLSTQELHTEPVLCSGQNSNLCVTAMKIILKHIGPSSHSGPMRFFPQCINGRQEGCLIDTVYDPWESFVLTLCITTESLNTGAAALEAACY